MCKSVAEGGQRCAAHTRPAYEAATPGTPGWDAAAAAYASTPTGRTELEGELDRAVEAHTKSLIDASAMNEQVNSTEPGGWTAEAVAQERAVAAGHLARAHALENALKRGAAMRERTAEVKDALAQARGDNGPTTRIAVAPAASVPGVAAILAAINDENDAAKMTFEQGTYPGSVTLTSKYEGVLLHSAEKCAEAGLFVHLKDEHTVYGDATDGYTITVSNNDDYGHHGYWQTDELFL